MDPFSIENLNRIFRLSNTYPSRISSRESSTLEFKQSFSIGSLENYAKTCAAFANTKGGYLVFGVRDSPRELIGLNDNRFETTDPERITDAFNNCFEPYIEWDAKIHEFLNMHFGIIYTYECHSKPILCKKTLQNKLREGEIYYRYSGRTQPIKYGELVKIFEERRLLEQRLWLQHLQKVSYVGIQNASVFDPNSGEISGPGGSFYIDERLLNSLSFIKEGSFSETEGSPTLKLVGKLQPLSPDTIQPIKEITRTKVIRSDEIILNFLDQNIVTEPIEYIKQICFETSGTLPVYYYMHLADLDAPSTVNIIDNIQSSSHAKKSLKRRLLEQKNYAMARSGIPLNGYNREDIRTAILNHEVHIDNNEKLRAFLKTIRTMSQEEVDKNYLLPLLKKHYLTSFSMNQAITQDFRYALCFLDKLLFSNR